MPATVAGTSERINARSRFGPLLEPLPVPRRLMSQNTPLATNPRGATMEPLTSLNFNFMWPRSVRMKARDATVWCSHRIAVDPFVNGRRLEVRHAREQPTDVGVHDHQFPMRGPDESLGHGVIDQLQQRIEEARDVQHPARLGMQAELRP